MCSLGVKKENEHWISARDGAKVSSWMGASALARVLPNKFNAVWATLAGGLGNFSLRITQRRSMGP
jgi:hypothetical protein